MQGIAAGCIPAAVEFEDDGLNQEGYHVESAAPEQLPIHRVHVGGRPLEIPSPA